ncbi:MAG: NAD(P)-dependent alcohol dehydrogenase [Sorangiineae bacterium]|nr:NAD(P)-dependent alcohol dehydrogenase [Polyangiaceae bacterium]MEB2322854.1 NAD(P)-dependent alcohol dehydrogenase [Sorangiineae bacterium]
MRAVTVSGAFGLDHLRIEERPEPEPGPGQVKLRMLAASLNFRDLRMVLGQYNPKQPLPFVPCSDGVGEVIALGAGVTRVKAGERVCPIFAPGYRAGRPTRARLRSTLGGPLDGTLVDYLVIDAEDVVPAPPHLTDAEAASLPCAPVTAWNALVEQGGLRPGDTVLVEGTGGVSISALQIAKLMGARVIVTSSSDEKLERARALGADETINYARDPGWGKTARAMTDEGVDHVVEVGGGKTIGEALRAVRVGGTISVIGVLSGVATDLSLLPILMGNVRLQGVLVGSRECFEGLARAWTQGGVRPVVDREFALADLRAALEHLQAGAHFGKLAIRIAP